jgi:multidrug/hemolysin transport system ATP-binding protein
MANKTGTKKADDIAIKINHLTKKYGSFVAVDDISFSVKTGTIFAFLGPNGAGKSTTINCMISTLGFDNGTITINHHDVQQDSLAVRRDIGVVFQQSLLDPTLTVFDNLLARARLYGLGRVEARHKITRVAKIIGLEEILSRRYGKLSGGQQRRADIARALVHQPQIVFLDEPTTGLDPQGRQLVWETIYKLQRELKLTVFLTTHYMEETERADQVYVIDHGKIIAHGTPRSLRAKYSRSQLRITAVDTLVDKLKKVGLAFKIKDEVITISGLSGQEAVKLITHYAEQIKDFEFIHGNMNDVFINLTGNDLREGGER